jgi:hypothetical protein
VQTFNFPKEIGFNYFGLGGDSFFEPQNKSFSQKNKGMQSEKNRIN